MSIYLEDHLPVVKFNGLNTQEAAVLESTLSVTGALTVIGIPVIPNPVFQQTVTAITTQSATPTIAQILGGIINHASVTGAGTCTVPTGTAMSAGVTGVAVGSTIKWLYYNSGTQTVTITAATDHTLVGGTAAVTTGKYMAITSYCSAANTWVSFLQTLM